MPVESSTLIPPAREVPGVTCASVQIEASGGPLLEKPPACSYDLTILFRAFKVARVVRLYLPPGRRGSFPCAVAKFSRSSSVVLCISMQIVPIGSSCPPPQAESTQCVAPVRRARRDQGEARRSAAQRTTTRFSTKPGGLRGRLFGFFYSVLRRNARVDWETRSGASSLIKRLFTSPKHFKFTH